MGYLKRPALRRQLELKRLDFYSCGPLTDKAAFREYQMLK
jgi:hypothetical protein